MTVPQLSVRSAKARDLAYLYAARENRTVDAIVEDALSAYARHHYGDAIFNAIAAKYAIPA